MLHKQLSFIYADERAVTAIGFEGADIIRERRHSTQRIIVAPAPNRVGAVTLGEASERRGIAFGLT